ncbi:ABC transporter permease subunit [Herbiconiux sp. CPCC 205763]|uniref:ABC transporter permease subunit n=1 Tax=Herbiconiux aconitum TaxID=2970913 RepID=A0ABT2GUP7_9MICO|nr:ABC transporter permease subunit [Herbiconiux aconitum]MCS5719267.1 ABC transporter permease subunit [Herbiconiux aconitum]
MSLTVKSARSRGGGRRGGILVLGLAPLAVLLALWQVFGTIAPSPFFPPPSAWIGALTPLLAGNALLLGILSTLGTYAESLAIAFVLGTAIGIAIGRSRLADRAFGPLLDYLRYLPAVAVVPVIVLFAGYTQEMKVYVVVFGAIWPILLQARMAAASIDPILNDVRRSLRLSRRAAFVKITLPSVMPSALLGLRLASPLTLILVLVVEISTQVSGLGRMLGVAQQNYATAQVFGLIVVIGVIALVVDAVIAAIERWTLRYRPAAD